MAESLDLPDFEAWSPTAVRLLQGPVYFDEPAMWDQVLTARTKLEDYFARLALLLVIDEAEGLAYLRQLADDELPEGYEKVPKLFRRTALGFDATLMCVLLRDELRRFDDEEMHDERCVVATATLFDAWKSLVPSRYDDVRQYREFHAILNKLDDLKFVKKFSDDPESWEIRRILKARLPLAELEALRDKMVAVLQSAPERTETVADE
jgi:hypothetical protein